MSKNVQANRLEAMILKIEKVHVKILCETGNDKVYGNLWPIPAPPRTLVVNWLLNRVRICGVRPENVVLTLPNGRTATADELINIQSELRMGDIRMGDAYRPDGSKPVAIGEIENRLLQRDGIVVVIRRPANDTVAYTQRRAADPKMRVCDYIEKCIGAYGIRPEEVVIINGTTMIPFVPPVYYTIGQLRETFKGKGK